MTSTISTHKCFCPVCQKTCLHPLCKWQTLLLEAGVERIEHRRHGGEQRVIVFAAFAHPTENHFEACGFGDRYAAHVEGVYQPTQPEECRVVVEPEASQ